MMNLSRAAYGVGRTKPWIPGSRPRYGSNVNRVKITVVSAAAQQQLTSSSDDPFESEDMKKALDDSFVLINEIVTFVCSSMVADNAVAYVTIKPTDTTLQNLISHAVADRLMRFNQMSLHTLHSMMASPTVKRDTNMLNLLQMLKDEILKQTGKALPEEILFLEELLGEKNEEIRINMLQDKTVQQLESVALAAGQIVSDMEETPAIADVPLLCAAVLLRDEVIAVINSEMEQPGDAALTGRQAVPEQVGALIKEVMRLPTSRQRQIMLFSALKEGLKAPMKDAEDGERELGEKVRPGVLMHSIDIIRAEMELNPQDVQGENVDGVVKRLWDLKADAIVVVRRIREGKLAHLSS